MVIVICNRCGGRMWNKLTMAELATKTLAEAMYAMCDRCQQEDAKRLEVALQEEEQPSSA